MNKTPKISKIVIPLVYTSEKRLNALNGFARIRYITLNATNLY